MNVTSLVRKAVPTYGYTAPGEAEVLYEMLTTRFTPDIWKLEKYEWQHVFVCDELKRDHVKHELLGKEREFRYPAYTQKSFRFWMPNDPTMSPIPSEVGDDHKVLNDIVGWPPLAKIKGEVWKIRPQQFIELDTYKQNTVQFTRKLVRLVVPSRTVVWLKDGSIDPDIGVRESGVRVKHTIERVDLVRAWMYTADPGFWDPIISAYDFNPVETFQAENRRWLDRYYHIRRPSLLK